MLAGVKQGESVVSVYLKIAQAGSPLRFNTRLELFPVGVLERRVPGHKVDKSRVWGVENKERCKISSI